MRHKRSVLIALMAVTVTIFSVWYQQRPVEPVSASWEDLLAEARAGNYRLVTTEQLAQWYRTGCASLLLVDTRQEWEYRSGHIKGAVLFPMEPTWWARWRKANDLAVLLGPDKNRRVVFY